MGGPMHIHIHNHIDGIDQPIQEAVWAAAGIPGHHVTFGVSAAEFAAAAPTVEILISPPWELHKFDLFAAPRLRMVQSTSAGVDSLQPFDRIPARVLLVNNRGTHAEKAGEFALMAILMLVNLIPRFVTDQRAERWARVTSGMAADHRLTIVGLGSLGGAAAAQSKRLGMKVTGIRNHAGVPHADCDRTLPPAALDEVLPETDILLLAAPLTPATANLLSAARIAALPAGAGVINMGRGGLVDQDALFDALDTGRLSGAVLDVFRTEPIPPGDRAWGVRNLIITPHMSADNPVTYNADTLRIFAKNLAALLAGERPPTLVDRALGY
jgi:phosphoglycerate dehydrogenase-like enzyme